MALNIKEIQEFLGKVKGHPAYTDNNVRNIVDQYAVQLASEGATIEDIYNAVKAIRNSLRKFVEVLEIREKKKKKKEEAAAKAQATASGQSSQAGQQGEAAGPAGEVGVEPNNPKESTEFKKMLESLRMQYNRQLELLAAFNVTKTIGGKQVGQGVDGRFYPVPPWEVVEAKLGTKKHLRKYNQGFKKLLLVPYAMKLYDLARAVTNTPSSQEHMVAQEMMQIHHSEDAFKDGSSLIYHPKRDSVRDNDGVQKEAQLEYSHNTDDENPMNGWETVLVEDFHEISDLPLAEQQRRRRVMKADEAETKFLGLINGNSAFKFEEAMTPEQWLILHMNGMADGRPYDQEKECCLLGAGNKSMWGKKLSFFTVTFKQPGRVVFQASSWSDRVCRTVVQI